MIRENFFTTIFKKVVNTPLLITLWRAGSLCRGN